jgi:hypothetical protein
MRPPFRRLAILVLLLGGCVTPNGLYSHVETSTNPRIWVVKGTEVFRCADGAAENAPPQPICVRAPTSTN